MNPEGPTQEQVEDHEAEYLAEGLDALEIQSGLELSEETVDDVINLARANRGEGVPAPVFASEDQNKRLMNVVGDDLYYRTDPGVSSSDPSLKNGESKVIRDRVWLVTTGEIKVIVEPVSEV
jgi:hypothetical protein